MNGFRNILILEGARIGIVRNVSRVIDRCVYKENGMYTRVLTDSECEMEAGERFTPVATLADEYGGRLQIAIDDHCYVLRLRVSKGGPHEDKYRTVTHIFREAFEVLRELPVPG